MSRASSIDLLPDEFREELNALLRDPRVSQIEAAAAVNEMLMMADEQMQISKSAVNRYSMKMDAIGKKLKQSREISNMWIAKLGSQPQGQVGLLLNEVVRNLAFDTAIALSEDEEPVPPKLIRELAVAIEKLERATSENDKRTVEIERRALVKAASRADQTAKNQGLSDNDWGEIRAKFLGIDLENE